MGTIIDFCFLPGMQDRRSRDNSTKIPAEQVVPSPGGKKKRQGWSAAEDETIRRVRSFMLAVFSFSVASPRALSVLQGQSANKNWDQIAQELGNGRSARSIRERFNKTLKVAGAAPSSPAPPGTNTNPIILNSPNNSTGPITDIQSQASEKPKSSQRTLESFVRGKRSSEAGVRECLPLLPPTPFSDCLHLPSQGDESAPKQRKIMDSNPSPIGNFNPAAQQTGFDPLTQTQVNEIRAEREKLEEDKAKMREWKRLLEAKETELKQKELLMDAREKELAARERDLAERDVRFFWSQSLFHVTN
jgi:hypothetical protein